MAPCGSAEADDCAIREIEMRRVLSGKSKQERQSECAAGGRTDGRIHRFRLRNAVVSKDGQGCSKKLNSQRCARSAIGAPDWWISDPGSDVRASGRQAGSRARRTTHGRTWTQIAVRPAVMYFVSQKEEIPEVSLSFFRVLVRGPNVLREGRGSERLTEFK